MKKPQRLKSIVILDPEALRAVSGAGRNPATGETIQIPAKTELPPPPPPPPPPP